MFFLFFMGAPSIYTTLPMPGTEPLSVYSGLNAARLLFFPGCRELKDFQVCVKRCSHSTLSLFTQPSTHIGGGSGQRPTITSLNNNNREKLIVNPHRLVGPNSPTTCFSLPFIQRKNSTLCPHFYFCGYSMSLQPKCLIALIAVLCSAFNNAYLASI